MSGISGVLVVDDSKIDRYLLKRILEKENLAARIFECSDGTEALNFLKSCQDYEEAVSEVRLPELIFLDLNMPLVDGFEFLKEFRKLRELDERHRSIRVVIHSSSTIDEDKKKSMEFDFVDVYLEKRIRTSKEMKRIIKNLFPLMED